MAGFQGRLGKSLHAMVFALSAAAKTRSKPVSCPVPASPLSSTGELTPSAKDRSIADKFSWSSIRNPAALPLSWLSRTDATCSTMEAMGAAPRLLDSLSGEDAIGLGDCDER
jgi:hypothetical protein